ncbi:MAG TPA: hypothetical protein VLR91_04875, partial [Thermodesulfobacteriota bacterium]|nr:hypothetical protein [Thermodesulfobacteriota bacterium]
VLTDWPIQALKSAARVQSGGFIFYLILLGITEIHAFLGVYRIFIKWGWWPRQPIFKGLVFAAIAFSTLGLFTLFVFLLFISAGGA